MSTPQEYWDACLIRTWRRHGTLKDAFCLFTYLTGKRTDEYDLKRLPPFGLKSTKSVKMFISYYLPKLNDWLWDKPPEKDIDLLKKLSVSKYDTLAKPHLTEVDKDLQAERQRLHVNRKRVGMSTISANNRNHDTDWNVVKGGKIGRRK